MKVLVIGSQGSMGKRYMAILKYLGVECEGVDIGQGSYSFEGKPDRVIVATPTDTHYEVLEKWIPEGKPILCEKPISKNIEEVKKLKALAEEHGTRVNMVCNYKYISPYRIKVGDYDIKYDHYNTGKDGLPWDCIQLIYLAKKINIKTSSPYLKLKYVGKKDYRKINLTLVSKSYITMIKYWLRLGDYCNEDLWTLDDAIKANEKVLKWIKENK